MFFAVKIKIDIIKKGFICYGMQKSFNQKNRNLNLNSIIICPYCGYRKEEIMPEDSCIHFYKCTNCKQILTPKKGDCCIFCSYGTVQCPPKQKENFPK